MNRLTNFGKKSLHLLLLCFLLIGILYTTVCTSEVQANMVSVVDYGWEPWEAESACGTPIWSNGMPAEGFSPAVAFSSWQDLHKLTFTITLPDGFSFYRHSLKNEKKVFNPDNCNHEYDFYLTIPTIYPVYLADAATDKYYYATITISGYAYTDYKHTSDYPFTQTIEVPFFHIIKAWDTASVTDDVLGIVSTHWSTDLMSNLYQSSTAEFSAILSQLAYSEDLLNHYLWQLGFTMVTGEGVDSYNYNNVGCYFARKTVIVNGETETFLLAIARGTTGASEWYGNFNVGSDTIHAGFLSASNQMYIGYFHYRTLNPENDVFSSSNHFTLITGHSKGAAAANIMAHRLGGQDFVAYTFATPTVTTAAPTNSSADAHIFNFVFYFDGIRNAPSMQYYRRYGNTTIFGYELCDQNSPTWTDSYGNLHDVHDGFTLTELINGALYQTKVGQGTRKDLISIWNLKSSLRHYKSDEMLDNLSMAHSMLNYLQAVRRNVQGDDIEMVNARTIAASNSFPWPDDSDFVVVQFRCPVNVYVYDENDTLVGSFVGDDITCTDNDLLMFYAGDARTVMFSNELRDCYHFVAIGYDDGTMTHTITSFTDDSCTLAIQENIPVTNGGEIQLRAQPTEDYTIYTDSDQIDELLGWSVESTLPCNQDNSCPSYSFTDIDFEPWYHDSVDYVVYYGLMNGMGNNRFEPQNPMTRGMLVTVLWRYAGSPVEGSCNFTDLAQQWYKQAVAWASTNGIVNGMGNNRFEPDSEISREQLAVIFFRYCSSIGIDTSARADLTVFPDSNQTSEYAQEAVSWAVAEGLITGMQQGSSVLLAPTGNATRAQVATILMRFIENVVI